MAGREGADLFIVEMAALLHDIADWKFHGGDVNAGPQAAQQWMQSLQMPDDKCAAIVAIIAGVSFKGANVSEAVLSLEGQVVQDADRLDAIGAIGIARCFAYGGHKGSLLHDPDLKPVMHESAKAYVSSRGTSLNHFYEKLLLLKDRMHTKTARNIAEQRHAFMQAYLKEFLAEWNAFK